MLAAHLVFATLTNVRRASFIRRLPPIVLGDAFTQLGTQINTILTEILTTVKGIAPIIAAMGLVTIGILYMGSSIPVISNWKQNNPQAFSNVIVGIFIVFAASTIVAIVPTS